MSLDVKKLEKVRELADGVLQARCPACAEGDGDRKGEHLRIYPDGRFGCCVHPKDGNHRKRVFALAGERERRQFTVRVAPNAKPAEPARSVKAVLAGEVRTLRTGDSKSEQPVVSVPIDLRTLRTPFSNPRAYVKEEDSYNTYTYKDWGRGVLSVLEPPKPGPSSTTGHRQRLPFFTADGTLSIPFDGPERYQWWKPGPERLRVKETTAELWARQEEVENGDY